MGRTLCVQVDFRTSECCFLQCCYIGEPLNSLIIEKYWCLSCPVMAFIGKSALPSFQLRLLGSQELLFLSSFHLNPSFDESSKAIYEIDLRS